MIGIPADAILAALWLIALANETGLIAGEGTMHFADTHIYEEHKEKAVQLAQLYSDASYYDGIPVTKWRYTAEPGKKLVDFLPSDVSLINYKAFGPKVDFILKD
jgi:thymidylate synthase